MTTNEIKSYFLANKNKWVYINEVINNKSVQIKAFVGSTVDLQIFKVDGLHSGRLNYQSITKTVQHITEIINLN